ncbi:MAG: nucleotidyltransferase domain-containing protein [Nanoarchaeota archaeon]
MIKKSTIETVLGLFFEYPTTEFHLRELSRKLRLSMPTIISMTDKLARENLIIKKKGKVITSMFADRENPYFIRKKRVNNLERMYDSGIVEYLTQEYNQPRAIIIFGSYSRGEDIEKSDIDVAVLTDKKISVDLDKFSHFFGKTINIHEIDAEKISKEFKANLSNGIVLEGSW